MASPFQTQRLVIRSFVLVIAFGVLASIAIGRYLEQQPTAGPDTAVEFDTCLQDDTTGDTLLFNSKTGDYMFCPSSGASVKGQATVTHRADTFELQSLWPSRAITESAKRDC